MPRDDPHPATSRHKELHLLRAARLAVVVHCEVLVAGTPEHERHHVLVIEQYFVATGQPLLHLAINPHAQYHIDVTGPVQLARHVVRVQLEPVPPAEVDLFDQLTLVHLPAKVLASWVQNRLHLVRIFTDNRALDLAFGVDEAFGRVKESSLEHEVVLGLAEQKVECRILYLLDTVQLLTDQLDLTHGTDDGLGVPIHIDTHINVLQIELRRAEGAAGEWVEAVGLSLIDRPLLLEKLAGLLLLEALVVDC